MLLVKEMLSLGADNARTASELCEYLGITLRELTAEIERERRNGVAICASTGSNPGYYLAANQEEMQQYCNRLSHRIKEIHKTREACLNTINTLPV